MIRCAAAARLQSVGCETEAAVRIGGLYRAYGLDSGFLRFYEGENGLLAAVMDGTVTLHAPCTEGDAWEEFCWFLAAQPDIFRVRSTAETVLRLTGFPQRNTGAVLAAPADLRPTGSTEPLSPRPLYTVLEAAFGSEAPPFEGFYVDLSHRLRHGCGRTVGVTVDGEAVACALTVAETETAAVIGGVATRPEHRRRGYAKACVTALTAALQAEHKRVLIAPHGNETKTLYAGWGFVPAGTWGEAER